MTEMERLAERVEAATGPDRELDVLIGCAAGYVPDKPGCEWAREPHWQYVPVPRISERIGCADKAGNVAAHWEAPAYTASLDAAMTLLGEGSEIDLMNLYGVARAHVDMNGEYGGFHGEHLGGSLALALCAAALRSRALSQQGEIR